jgi:hypothetical protein
MPRPVPERIRKAIWQRMRRGQVVPRIAEKLASPVRTVRQLVQRFHGRGESAIRPDYRHRVADAEAQGDLIRQTAHALRREHPLPAPLLFPGRTEGAGLKKRCGGCPIGDSTWPGVVSVTEIDSHLGDPGCDPSCDDRSRTCPWHAPLDAGCEGSRTMTAVLMVPMHLDALVLEHELSVLEPMADFRRLPYFNGQ